MDAIYIIQDRTFDAECAKRAGLVDLHDEILRRLKETHPDMVEYIEQCRELYSHVGEFLTDERGKYLKEHLGKLKLRYK